MKDQWNQGGRKAEVAPLLRILGTQLFNTAPEAGAASNAKQHVATVRGTWPLRDCVSA